MKSFTFRGLICVSLLGFALPASAQQADLTRFVVVGDSLSAGYRNFSLLSDYQQQSYAALIAKQAGTPLALPLIAKPGIPSELVLKWENGLPVIAPTPGLPSTGRIDGSLQAANLAVPGQRVDQGMLMAPRLCLDAPPACIPGNPILHPADGIQTLTNLVLGLPGFSEGLALSQVQWVERFSADPAKKPTFLAVWLGNNDALFSVLLADPTKVTPAAIFRIVYGTTLSRLGVAGAPIVTANIPDVTSIPYLTPMSKLALPLAILFRRTPAQIYQALGVESGEYLTPTALYMVLAMVKNRQLHAIPELCAPPIAGLAETIPCTVSAAGIQAIHNTVLEYNQIIQEEAQARGIAVVDVHGLFKRIASRGYQVGGRRLTTNLFGGIFSLDAIHPTATGQAILANEFIQTLNSRYGTNLPLVSVAKVMKDDPLVFSLSGFLQMLN
jgi:lysophospholipase L1-like esterase